MPINQFTQHNIYVNGASYTGEIEKVGFPSITPEMADKKGIGLAMKMKLPTGIYEVGEALLTLETLKPKLEAVFLDTQTAVTVQVRGNYQTFGSAGRVSDKELLFEMRGYPMGNTPGEITQGTDPKPELKLAPFALQLKYDSVVYMDIDGFENRYSVNPLGNELVDVLTKAKVILGIGSTIAGLL